MWCSYAVFRTDFLSKISWTKTSDMQTLSLNVLGISCFKSNVQHVHFIKNDFFFCRMVYKISVSNDHDWITLSCSRGKKDHL